MQLPAVDPDAPKESMKALAKPYITTTNTQMNPLIPRAASDKVPETIANLNKHPRHGGGDTMMEPTTLYLGM